VCVCMYNTSPTLRKYKTNYFSRVVNNTTTLTTTTTAAAVAAVVVVVVVMALFWTPNYISVNCLFFLPRRTQAK